MRRDELELEHKYRNRFVARHRLKGSSTTLGSSRDADILLLGDDVGGLHAVIERQQDGWKISDLGSAKGTWIEKEPIVEQEIQSTTMVRIGGHTLTITPRSSTPDLFSTGKRVVVPAAGTELFHQIVIRHKGYIHQTVVIGEKDSFHLQLPGGVDQRLSPPRGTEWVTQTFGQFIVQQRLVSSKENSEFLADKSKEPFDPNLKISLMIAGGIGLILAIFISFELRKPSDATPVKPDVNNFTKMIYDAKALKSKREQATKATKSIVGQQKSLGGPEPQPASVDKSQKPVVSKKAAMVVTKIRSAGLSQLIGKISKRAATTANYIESTGRAPDSLPSGPAASVAGSAAIKKGAQVGTQSYRVGGVATSGKGGGSSSYRGVGGLSVGNVGNATVGVLEDESEVAGGLDKEVIAGVIKGQLGQIRYCYERQLSANPELYGKVQIRFTIGDGGEVVSQSIGSTTLNNAMVEGCILRRVSGWRFPKPKGGTAVIVTYPFLFKATN